MKLNILIGGKAGQGINKVSEIVQKTLASSGYFAFNSRNYGSLIRGGHNFNLLSVSDKWIASNESKTDIITALDENTIKVHKKKLKDNSIKIDAKEFESKNLGRNLNIALAGALIKTLGIDKNSFLEEIKKEFNNKEALSSAEIGFNSQKEKFNLKKLNNKIQIMSGNQGISQGALNSKIDIYFSYPMTPATGVMHELASKEIDNSLIVFQPENEIAGVNSALGASFAGAKTMIGTSGGGFDLMTEALSFSGMSEIPIVFYLASRPGPSTGVPTYTSQADLNVALRSGHGEFPRVALAPGDPIEAIENTNQAFYLSEKFKIPVIVLSDKHLAESEFSLNKKPNKTIEIIVKRKIPGKEIVKASSYEHDEFGNTTEEPEIIKKNAERRIQKYENIKKELNNSKNIQMIKIYGKKNSKNLIIGWGSTKGAILDAINSPKENLDTKFLQIIYLKPISDEIKLEMQKAKNIILIENNSTGQLGRLLREKTGISIPEKNRILKYDARPFLSDELRKEIKRRLK